MDQDNVPDKPEPLRITAPPLHTSCRFVYTELTLIYNPNPCNKCLRLYTSKFFFWIRHPGTESPPAHTQTDTHALGKTHLWVSSRHGDISDWGPYSGLLLNACHHAMV